MSIWFFLFGGTVGLLTLLFSYLIGLGSGVSHGYKDGYREGASQGYKDGYEQAFKEIRTGVNVLK